VLPLLLFDVPFDCGVCFDAKVRIDGLIVLEFGDRSRSIMFVILEEPKKTKPTFHHNAAAQ
jgi:hypothetical protein